MSGLRFSRRSVLVAAVGALPLAMLAAPAGACAEWCDDDPPIRLVAPDGTVINANVTVKGRSPAFRTFAEQSQYIGPALQQVTITTSSQYAGSSDVVEFTVDVTIPDYVLGGSSHDFETMTIISSQPGGAGTVYAKRGGRSGQTETIRFQLRRR